MLRTSPLHRASTHAASSPFLEAPPCSPAVCPLLPSHLRSILPLETICNTIETNVWELHRAHSTAAAEAQQEAARRGAWSQQAQQGQQGPQQVDADLLVSSMVSPWGGRRW